MQTIAVSLESESILQSSGGHALLELLNEIREIDELLDEGLELDELRESDELLD